MLRAPAIARSARTCLGSRSFTSDNGIAGIGTYEAVLPDEDHKNKLNKYSAVITQRKTQGAGQAQLYATDVGKIKDGMSKPQVGISSVW